MSVLSQSFLSFVSSHLVALFLFSVWHSLKSFKWVDIIIIMFVFYQSSLSGLAFLFAFHLGHEALGGLEAGEIVRLDHDSSVFRDVACGFFSSVLSLIE